MTLGLINLVMRKNKSFTSDQKVLHTAKVTYPWGKKKRQQIPKGTINLKNKLTNNALDKKH